VAEGTPDFSTCAESTPQPRGEREQSLSDPMLGGHLVPEAPRTLVARDRLLALFDRCTERTLTILVAPAGSGKTSALAAWAATSARPVTWIGPLSPGGAAGALRATLHDLGDEPRVVIVDDAHALPADVWADVDAWLNSPRPDTTALVFASRRDLPLSLVAWEITGQLSMARADALRFTDVEARELIHAHAPQVSDEDADIVQARASGWAAALVLAARALGAAGHQGQARDALARTSRPILDYLLDEVFGTLPATVQHVLLCTADTPTLTAVTARVLTTDPHADEVLSELATDGFLVLEYDSTTDPRTRVWRYHPLLADLLRRQISQSGPDRELARNAHQRAARHFSVHGPVVEAIRHAALGGMQELLASLLIEEGPALLTAGEHELLDMALKSLPGQLIEDSPALLSVAALARSERGDTEVAARLSATAIRTAENVQIASSSDGASAPLIDAADQALLADVVLLQSWRFRYGWTDVDTVIGQARDLLGCQMPTDADPATAEHQLHAPRWRLTAARNIWLLNELTAAEVWASQLSFAAAHNRDALTAATALGHSRLLAAALANRGLVLMCKGRGQDADRAAAEALQLAERLSLPDPVVLARARLVRCWQAISELRYADATELLDILEHPRILVPDPIVDVTSALLRTFLVAEAGDVGAARQALDEVSVTASPLSNALQRVISVQRARWALSAGDPSSLREQADRLALLEWAEAHQVFAAAADAFEGDVHAGLATLDRVLAGPLGGTDASLAAIAAAVRVRLLSSGDDPTALRRAFYDLLNRLEAQHRLEVFTFLDPFDKPVNDLLRMDAARAVPHPLTAELLAGLGRYRSHRRSVTRPPGPPVAPVARVPQIADGDADELPPVIPALPPPGARGTA
jgi:hypothetical protein